MGQFALCLVLQDICPITLLLNGIAVILVSVGLHHMASSFDGGKGGSLEQITAHLGDRNFNSSSLRASQK